MNSKPKELYRSRNKRMFAGVCGGLGNFFNVDPTLIRILFVLGTLFGVGSLLIVYIILMVIVPEEPLGENPVDMGSASVFRAPAESAVVEPDVVVEPDASENI
jgi:phage shock protein C